MKNPSAGVPQTHQFLRVDVWTKSTQMLAWRRTASQYQRKMLRDDLWSNGSDGVLSIPDPPSVKGITYFPLNLKLALTRRP